MFHIYPVTTLGRIMAICIAYLGVGAVAIPTGIISAGFVEQYQRKSSIISEYELIEIRILFLIKQDCYVYVTLLLSRGHIYGSPAVLW
jgi:voltage-gated potassium channel